MKFTYRRPTCSQSVAPRVVSPSDTYASVGRPARSIPRDSCAPISRPVCRRSTGRDFITRSPRVPSLNQTRHHHSTTSYVVAQPDATSSVGRPCAVAQPDATSPLCCPVRRRSTGHDFIIRTPCVPSLSRTHRHKSVAPRAVAQSDVSSTLGCPAHRRSVGRVVNTRPPYVASLSRTRCQHSAAPRVVP